MTLQTPLRAGLIALLATGPAWSASIALAANDTAPAQSQPSGDANAALMKKLEMMERRIKSLEAQVKKQQADAAPAPNASPQAPPRRRTDDANTRDANARDASARDASAGDAKAAPADAQAGPAPQAANWPAASAQATPAKPILGLVDSPVKGLSLGAYGELKFGTMQNPAAGGQWQNGFDTARFVLLPTYAITDNIIFNAEIEFEHAGAGFDNDDKLHGTAEIEQAWVDFKILQQFNWRAPGVDLVPIGFINQHHEPTLFYSVNRPELYNGLIPSTWKVPSTSVYGTIADGLKYQVMVSTSNEDFGDSFDNRTDANAAPAGPYMAGIDGLNGLGFSNPPLGDFRQLNNALAVSGRLDVAPPFLPGFAGSVSGYYSPNTTPRGAHDDLGNPLGKSSLAMLDAEFRYRIPETWVELRGEYVRAMFGNPANLRANNDSDPTNNVGKAMVGASGEIAVHIPMGTILGSDWEAVPFYRYTWQNLQTSGFAGTDLNLPTGAGQTQFHTAGVAVFPSPNLVLKATYQRVINNDPAGARSDSVLGAVGFFF